MKCKPAKRKESRKTKDNSEARLNPGPCQAATVASKVNMDGTVYFLPNVAYASPATTVVRRMCLASKMVGWDATKIERVDSWWNPTVLCFAFAANLRWFEEAHL